MENVTPHSLNIEQCKRISATAIESVDSFSDKQIVLFRRQNSRNRQRNENCQFLQNKRFVCGYG